MQTLTFTLLALSILSVWLPPMRLADARAPAWPVVYLAALSVALASGVVRWEALPSIAAFAAITCAATRADRRAWRVAATVGSAVMALALSVHRMPGFDNPKLFDAVQVSSNAPPFTQYLNFDKGTAGLFLLAAFAPRLRVRDAWNAWRSTFAVACAASAMTAAVVLGVACAFGVVGFDPKLPPDALAFLATNLFFTCVAEEAFFRGLIQERIAGARPATAARATIAIVASSALFALAHLPGGPAQAGLAGLTGLGYAAAYQATRRIEAAVATHLAVNAAHFLWFTYPQVAP
jgi:hypothetical protein